MVVAILLPTFAAVLVFLNTLSNGFVFDDEWTLGNLTQWSTDWQESITRGRSLTYAFHALDRFLWSDWAPGFHLTNVLLHGVATGLTAYLATLLARSTLVGFLTGILFAIHPVHVEAVAGVSFRKDILAMVFATLSLILWVRARTPALYVAAIACFLCGLLAKEVAVIGLLAMLPFARFALATPDGRRDMRLRSELIRWAPFLAIGLVIASMLVGGLPEYFHSENIRRITGNQVQSYSGLLPALVSSIPVVARLLLVPLRLAPDYPPPSPSGLLSVGCLSGLGILTAWCAGSLALVRRDPLIAFAMVWTALMFLPVSGVVPLHHIFIAERYLYVPSFGICFLVGLLFQRLTLSPLPRWSMRWCFGALAVVVVAGAVRSVDRNRDWHDRTSLWTAAGEAGVDTWRVHLNLGYIALDQGALVEAERHLQRARDLGAAFDRATMHLWLGQAALDSGSLPDAEDHLRRALKEDQPAPQARTVLATVVRLQGRPREALELLDESRENERDAQHVNERAIVLTELGRRPEAMAVLRAGIEAFPEAAVLHLNLGSSLLAEKEYEEAVACFQRHQQLDPENPQSLLLWGQALYGSGQVSEAEALFAAVVRITPNDANAHNALAMAQAVLGHGEEAVASWNEALRINPDLKVARQNLEAWRAAERHDPGLPRR